MAAVILNQEGKRLNFCSKLKNRGNGWQVYFYPLPVGTLTTSNCSGLFFKDTVEIQYRVIRHMLRKGGDGSGDGGPNAHGKERKLVETIEFFGKARVGGRPD